MAIDGALKPDATQLQANAAAALAATAFTRAVGTSQAKQATIDLAQGAASYDLFTGTTGVCLVTGFSLRLPNVNVSDDATITGISVQTNDATPRVIISQAEGLKAYLTAEYQIEKELRMQLAVGKKIQLTIYGGAADAETICTTAAEYKALAAGGYLA